MEWEAFRNTRSPGATCRQNISASASVDSHDNWHEHFEDCAPTPMTSGMPSFAAWSKTRRWNVADSGPSSPMSPRTATRRPAHGIFEKASSAAIMESGFAL